MLKKLFGLATAVSFLALAGVAEAGDLKLGHSTWVGYGPFYVARDKGFFKEEGVNVELVIMEDTPIKMGALMAGQLDLVASTADEFPIYMKPGIPVKYVLAVDNSKGGDGIVVNKDIADIAGLKGKKVAFEQGSVSQFFLNALLKDAGMSQADIEPVNMAATDAGVAFAAKQVDAAVTWEPALSQGAKAEHGKILLTSADKPGLITDVVAATADTVANKKEDIAGFVRAWYKALDFIKSNPDEANAIMAQGVGGWLSDPTVFAETLTGIEYLDKDKNVAFFGTPEAPGQIYKTLGAAIDIWKGFDRIQVDVKPADIIDHSFVGG
jgi:NitT/TauT family transport system substrate-binding protein